MADSKLSALTEATTLDDADELLVNDSGTSKRITMANAANELSLYSGIDNVYKQITTASTFYYAAGLGVIDGWSDQSYGTTLSGSSNSLFLMPIRLFEGTTITGLVCYCSVASDGDAVWSAGLYDSDGTDGMAETLLASGTADITTIGQKIVVVDYDVTQTRWAWFAAKVTHTTATINPDFKYGSLRSTILGPSLFSNLSSSFANNGSTPELVEILLIGAGASGGTPATISGASFTNTSHRNANGIYQSLEFTETV